MITTMFLFPSRAGASIRLAEAEGHEEQNSTHAVAGE